MDAGAYIQQAILNDYLELQRRHGASKAARSDKAAELEVAAHVQQTALLGRLRSNVWRGAEEGKREQVLRSREELKQLYIKTFRDPEGLDDAVHLVQRNRIAELEELLENSQTQHQKAMDTDAEAFIDTETALQRDHESEVAILRAEHQRELETIRCQHQFALDQASKKILSLKDSRAAAIQEVCEEKMKSTRLLVQMNDSPDFTRKCYAAALSHAEEKIAEYKQKTSDLLVQISTCSSAEALAELQKDLYRTRYQVKLHKTMKQLAEKMLEQDCGPNAEARSVEKKHAADMGNA
ncbi:hypothetical protein LTR22_017014 [Elasticomyces elasticus]|nr:hypothetical protein LTR22_017014 [Elasticomyces elasticus]